MKQNRTHVKTNLNLVCALSVTVKHNAECALIAYAIIQHSSELNTDLTVKHRNETRACQWRRVVSSFLTWRSDFFLSFLGVRNLLPPNTKQSVRVTPTHQTSLTHCARLPLTQLLTQHWVRLSITQNRMCTYHKLIFWQKLRKQRVP